MPSLPDDEIAFFASALDDHQRTYLNRLLGECLSSLGDDGHDALPAPQRLRLVQEHLQPLMRMLACLREFEANERSDIRPFAVQMPEPGHVLVVLSPRLSTWRGIWDPSSHDWVVQLAPGKVSVDVGTVGDLASAVIAWLVTLAGRVPGGRVHLRHVSARTEQALRVLRLDSTLVVTR